jgi:hypothetical protein
MSIVSLLSRGSFRHHPHRPHPCPLQPPRFLCCPRCRRLHCPCRCRPPVPPVRCECPSTGSMLLVCRLSSRCSLCPPAKPLLPLVALFFIMADYYIAASASAPSSHCSSCRHCCYRIVIVTAYPTYGGIPSEEEKGRKVYFYLWHNKLKKTNLDRVFSKSRSGMIAHKNKK